MYTSDDGLPESWVSRVVRGPSGRIWTTHGIVDVGVFDGYTMRRMPGTSGDLEISEAPDGTLWALLRRGNACIGVQRLVGNRWEEFPIAAAKAPIGAARLVAWGAGRVLLLTPERIFEFHEADRSVRSILHSADTRIGTFVDMRSSEDGGVWITTTRGVAALPNPLRQSAQGRFTIALPPGIADARSPFDSPRGLVVSARDSAARGGVLLRLEHGKWTRLIDGAAKESVAAGWSGYDDTIWIVRSSTTRAFKLSVFREGEAEHTFPVVRALSGAFNDVEADPHGGFWLATSLGLLRYLPPIWRRPAGAAGEQVPSGSLVQTANGDVYVAQERRLLRLAGGEWRQHLSPPAHPLNPNYSDQLASLADGRLVVGTTDRTQALTFDPATSRFDQIVHPEGRWVEVLGAAPRYGAWAVTRVAGSVARIESYDGRQFTRRFTTDSDWEEHHRPRFILETRRGDVFIAPTPHGIGWLRGQEMQWLQPATGTLDVQPFAAAELADGTIWFGGREGVSTFDGAKVTHLRSGLQTVRSIVQARDGSVWVASNSGVHRFAAGTWISMTDVEGLPSAAVSDVFEDRSGRVWLSTTAGLTLRHPEADRDPPETMIEADQNPRDAPPSGDIRFVYRGLDRWHHTGAARLMYSHRIDNNQWSSFTSQTSVALSHLAAGRHTFAVRAMDRNGNVDASPATWAFTVVLPWYREPGVVGMGAVAALALGAAILLFATRHVRLERLVRARTEQLQEELAERTRMEQERARLEEQLAQSQKMDALGRLAGGIAHDFNNLLTVINSYGELLTDDLDRSDPRRQHAEEIVKAAHGATSLTKQLLSFSRHQGIQRELVDLNGVLGDLRRMLQRLLGERIELDVVTGPALWPVLADRSQVEQVIVNLAVNARDAMPDGGKLAFETANLDLDDAYVRERVNAQPGPHVRLSVTDSGTGMDEETRQRIFEPFFTTKARDKGTGLGLATVYGIVAQSGGHIVVDSAPGRGTRFDIYLPRSGDHVPPRAEPGVPSRRGGTETILLVEDERAVRDLATRALRGLGYNVVPAASAEHALRLVEGDGLVPDLLVTDVVMPGMNGRQLADRLMARMPDLPVLLMSGYTTDTAVAEAPGMAFLQKPFTPTGLDQAVRRLLSS